MITFAPLTHERLDMMLFGTPFACAASELHKSYFSYGSPSCCLLDEGSPVFAGGIVNLQWRRGEAWILPTDYFRSHIKTCLREMREVLPKMAIGHGFVRVQATCVKDFSGSLFRHLGFNYEGTMVKFGPNGETCGMYARIFE